MMLNEPKVICNLRRKLDLEWKSYTGDDRRIEARLRFHRLTCVRFMQTSGDVLATESYTRNLSPTGVGLLHIPFAYPNSSVVVTLTLCRGPSIHIASSIQNCRYIGKQYHSSSILFHERIELEDFLFEAELGEAQRLLDQSRLRYQRTQRSEHRLHGMHVLIVEADPEALSILSGMIRAEGASLDVVPFLGDAIDRIRTRKVDLLLCRDSHDGADTLQIIKLCREQGFIKPIIGLSWNPETLLAARAFRLTGRIDSIDPDSIHEINNLFDRVSVEHD